MKNNIFKKKKKKPKENLCIPKKSQQYICAHTYTCINEYIWKSQEILGKDHMKNM